MTDDTICPECESDEFVEVMIHVEVSSGTPQKVDLGKTALGSL